MGACSPSGIRAGGASTTLSVDPELFHRLARRIARASYLSLPSARGISTVDFATVIEWSGILNSCELQYLDDFVGATVRAIVDVLWLGSVMRATTAEEYLHYLNSVDALITNLLSQGRQLPSTNEQPHPPKVVHRLLANRLGTILIERKVVSALKAGTLRLLNVEVATLRIVSYWLALAPDRVASANPGWIAVKGLMRDHKIDISVAELLADQRVSFRYQIDWWLLLQASSAKQDVKDEVRALATSVLRVSTCCGGFLKLIRGIKAAVAVSPISPSRRGAGRSRRPSAPSLLRTFTRAITLELGSRLQNHVAVELQNALRSMPRHLKGVVSNRSCDRVDVTIRETICLRILSAVCDAFEQLSRPTEPTTEEILCCLVMHSLLPTPSKSVDTPVEDDDHESNSSVSSKDSAMVSSLGDGRFRRHEKVSSPRPTQLTDEEHLDGPSYAEALGVLVEVYSLSINSRVSWSTMCRDIRWLSEYSVRRLEDVVDAVRRIDHIGTGRASLSEVVDEDATGEMKQNWSKLARRFCTLVDRLAGRGSTLVLEADRLSFDLAESFGRCQRLVMQLDAENIVSFAKELGVPMEEVDPQTAVLSTLRGPGRAKAGVLAKSLPSCLPLPKLSSRHQLSPEGSSSESDSPLSKGPQRSGPGPSPRNSSAPNRGRTVHSSLQSKADRTATIFDFPSIIRGSLPAPNGEESDPVREAVRQSTSFEFTADPRVETSTFPTGPAFDRSFGSPTRGDLRERLNDVTCDATNLESSALLAMLREQRELNKSLLDELRQSREQFVAAVAARDRDQVVAEAVDAAHRDRERHMQALKHDQFIKSLALIGTSLSPKKGQLKSSGRPGVVVPLTARPAVQTPMLQTLLARESLRRSYNGDSAPTSYVTTSRTDYNKSNLRAMDNLFDNIKVNEA
ncbi:hypothetical protein FOL47_004241 [Perkinsus chesapeaki]|uniref:Uncharacterized protein n=1 Tax=Perkinsus chesapeaki TaxID=330153 RepID=A0A7J6M3J3_PERCH|nr:hypothetical protein FOL47_004241 [Perkinsus chesapeaki]